MMRLCLPMSRAFSSRVSLRRFLSLGFMAMLACGSLSAQTAHLLSGQRTLGSGFVQPLAVAVDSSGNVYVSNANNNFVYKETLSGGMFLQPGTVVSNPINGTGVAVDSSGNVFTVDDGSGNLLKATPSGGTYTLSSISSFTYASSGGMAVDSSGNLYITDPVSNAVYKETLSGGTYTHSTLFSTGFTGPTGIAIDSSGNLYIAGTGTAALLKETLVSGTTYTQSTIGTGLSGANAVAVDSSGNVYIADAGNNRIFKETLSGGVYTQSAIATGLNQLTGIAVDSNSGNIYFVGKGYTTAFILQTGAVNLGTVPIGSPETATLTFTFDTAGKIGAHAILTQGATGLDFTDLGTGTCNTNGTSHSYNVNDTCTVDVQFSPTITGFRPGAVTLTNASGTIIATAYVYGSGAGSQVAFTPPTQSALFSAGTNSVWDVAVDGSGDIFYADSSANTLTEVVAVGGSIPASPVTRTFTGGLNFPIGIAIDGAGNIYVANENNSTVVEFVAVQGVLPASPTVRTLGSFSSVQAVAVDGSGNVYVATGSAIVEMLAVNGAVPTAPTTLTFSSGFTTTFGVAVDGSGNVFVADRSANAVKELVAVNGSVPAGAVPRTLATLSAPQSVAVDGRGNVYECDVLETTTHELLAVGGTMPASPSVITLGSGFHFPSGMATNAAGDLFVADRANNRVVKLNSSDPPTLTFPTSTAVGATDTTDGTQTVTLSNIGTGTLSFPIPSSSGYNPSIGADFTLDSTSSGTCPLTSSSASAAGTLAVGASCTLPIIFTPQSAGSISDTLVLTDNNLNTTGATQTITLKGTGTAATTATHFSVSAPLSAVVGTSFTVAVAALDSTETIVTGYTGTVHFTSTDTAALLPADATLTNGSRTFTTTLNTAGSQTITATDTVTSSITGTSSAISVSVSPQTITFGALADKFTTDPPFTVSAAASSALPVSFSVYAATAYGWVTGTVMPGVLNTAVAGAPGDGMIYVAGGSGASGRTNALQQYNPATQTWATKTPMPTARYQASGGSIGGLFYVAGGWASSVPSNVLEVYNPATNSWTNKTPMSHLSGCGMAGVIGGKLYVFTPCNGNSGYFSLLDAYDPVANSWASLPAGPTSHASGAGGVINGKLYVVGGIATSTLPTAELDVYDPASGWSTKTSMPAVLTGISGDVIDGKLYVTGGTNSSAVYQSTVYIYDPVADSWSTYTSMPAAFANAAAVAMNGALYVAGGSNAGGNLGTFQILNTNDCTLSGNTVTIGGAGICTVAASQAGNSNYTAAPTVTQSFNITAPPAAMHFSVTAPANASAGVSFNVTVTAQDAGNATVTGYNGTMHFTSTDGAAVLPANATLTNGTGTFTVTLNTGGAKTVTATDTVTSSITGGASVTVSTALDANMRMTATGSTYNVGDNITLHATVDNELAAITTGTAIQVTITLPAGMMNISASGTGYSYVVSSTTSPATITATYNGTYPVAGGTASMPTITISGIFTAAAAGSYNATAQVSVPSDINPVNDLAQVLLTIGTTAPTITFNVSDHAFGDADFAVNATSNSAGAFTYTVVSGPATIATGTNTVHLTGAGSVELSASEAAATGYTTGTQTVTFSVTAGTAAITFTVPNHVFGDADFSVSASSASTGAFTYTVLSGLATIATGTSTVHLTGAGSVTLKASQAADPNYATGSQTVTFNVAGGTAAITFTVPNHTFGDADFTVSASSSSTGAFTYSLVSGPATVTGSTVHLTGAGTVMLKATQAADANYATNSQNVSFNVSTASPAIVFTVPAHTFGDADFTVNATSNSTGAFTYSLVSGPATVTGSTVHLTGAGSVTLKATEAADSNYSTGSQNVTFNVATIAPTITFSVPAHTFGDADFAVSATSNSVGTITYSVSSGPATITGNVVHLTNSGTVILTASQVAAGNYTTGTQNASFNVSAATATLTFTVPNHTYGDAPFAVGALSPSSGTITYSVVSGPASIAGNTVTLTGAGSVTLLATQAAAAPYSSATKQATFAVAKATPSVAWTTPAAISYGTAVSATQLNASVKGVTGATLAGSLVYTPIAGTVPQAPSQLLSLLFTPVDTTDYNTATASVALTVNTATLNIIASSATRVYGTANPTFTGTITGQKNGDTFTESFATTAVTLSPVSLYSIVPSAAGTHLADYTQSVQNGTLTVTQAGTNSTLTIGTHTPIAGQNNTYTATVVSQTSGTPTGTVQFLDNGSVFGSATLVAGQAVLTSSLVGVGTHTIAATYGGDGNFKTSTATATGGTDVVTPPDFNFTLNTISAVNMDFGGTATFTFRLTPQAGAFYREVDFSHVGEVPLTAVASFSPATIAAGAGTTDVTFTVATHKFAWYRSPAGIAGQTALCLLLLPFAMVRRRSKQMLSRAFALGLLLLISVGAMVGITGCGSGYAEETYPITISASSAGITHSVIVVVHVNKTPQ